MTHCHHDARGHGAGVTPPRSMSVGFFFFFCDFPTDFLSFPLFVSLFLFSFLLCIYLIVLFWPCFFTEISRALEKKTRPKSNFQNSIFQGFFSAFESFWCPPSMCVRTGVTCIQGHGTGTYKEININIICE